MNDPIPYLSVVICTYNRQKFIEACLQCLSVQTLPVQYWEAIVVDNHSTDRSAEIAKDFIAQHPALPFRYVFEEKQGLSFARNCGIAESRGEAIVYIDDDVEAPPEYLQVIYDWMKAHPQAAGMGGKTLPKFSDGPPPAWYNPYMVGITGTVDRGDTIKKFGGRMKYPSGCNMVYRKAILQQVGGFDNELKTRGDDTSIYEKVARVNDDIWYVPQAFSLHNIDAARLTDASFKRLYTKNGEGINTQSKSEGGVSPVKKGVMLLAKLGAGVGLWALYATKGKTLQGRYIYLSQWYTLKGFLAGPK